MAGKLIAIYGINNLGKTTQAERLVARLEELGVQAAYLKYALYDLEPSGPLLDAYLRNGNPHNLSPREFQILQVLNRTQHDAELRSAILDGTSVVAEDYIGTGVAWGVGGDVSQSFLVACNTHLLEPDVSILLDGDRFLEGKEVGHKHEGDDSLTDRVRHIHLDLAREYGWHVVDANRPIKAVHAEIFGIVIRVLNDDQTQES